jgi:hypothetical protein
VARAAGPRTPRRECRRLAAPRARARARARAPLPPAAPPSRRLAALLPALRPWFARAAKAKTAKLVRTVVEALARVPGAEATLSRVLTDAVAWAKAVRA